MPRKPALEASDKQKARQAHILLSKYDRLYHEKHNQKKIFNRYSAKWGMIDVIDSVGFERANELLDYFFTTRNDHTLEFFYKNFDKMHVTEKAVSADRERRARIRRETLKRVQEEGHQ